MASSTDDSVQHFGARVLRFTHRVLELIVGLLLSFVYRGPPQHVPPISNMLLLETAESLALKIRKRKVKSEDVVESFIARIKEVNPMINCVVADRFDDALKEAKEVDAFLATSGKSEAELAAEKPFLGVPFTTKECLEAKGMSFSAGLYARKDVKGTKNAEATQCMCEAGAILLATTNTSELAMWWESHNYVHGRSKNPYDTSRIVGGSSGGEGAVLAAAGSPMGLGSDIGGSIRMPAFFNGIFGHKPSKFIVSNEGQYPFPSEEDHASFLGIGPMCRYATDLVPIMKVIAAKNALKLDLDSKVNVSKLKVYYAEDDGGSVLVSPVNPEIKAAVRRTVMFLEKAHGIKAQKVNMKIMKHSISIWMAKMKSRKGGKFARELNNSETTPINVWWGLLKWVLCMSRHTFIALCTAITENYGVQYGSPHHQKMLALCDELRIQMVDMLGDDGVFIYPTHPTPAPYHNEPLVKPFNFSYSGIFNVLGLPATHCPMGLNSRGLPIGIQVVAGPNQDKLTLAMAVEFEKAFGGWVPPSVNV